MDATHSPDPLEDAREHAERHLQQLREREQPASPVPDLRTLLSRAEEHVEQLGGTARELAAILPTRVEAAVSRALVEDEGGIGRRLDELRAETLETSSAVGRIERDLVAERLGRVEDLEVIVDLLIGGLASLRADVARLAGAVEALGRRGDAHAEQLVQRIEAPLRVTVARSETEPARSSDAQPVTPSPAYHHLFARTEPTPVAPVVPTRPVPGDSRA